MARSLSFKVARVWSRGLIDYGDLVSPKLKKEKTLMLYFNCNREIGICYK